MKCEFLWKEFENTGDPMCYLLYKTLGETADTDIRKIRETIPV